jgi:hypothetical protein
MGPVAAGAALTFGAALGLLAMFFATKDDRFDRAAEWSFVGFAILAVPMVLSVGGRFANAGATIVVATVLGVGGAVVLGLGELAMTLKVVDFRRLAPAMALAFVAYLGWIGIVGVLTIAGAGDLPLALGWLAVLSIIVTIAAVGWILATPGVPVGAAEPSRTQMIAFVLPLVGVIGWMLGLAANL